jgi:hypothetical protein
MPGFFVSGPAYRLPHPNLDARVVLITHRALVEAFRLLRARPPSGFVLATAKEDDITRQIYRILEDDLLRSKKGVKGFDRRRFERVVRAPEVTNYDGTHLVRKPDLVLFVMNREHLKFPSQDALFAECKPIDEAHAIGRHYCDRGLGKFVNGDYAWAMQEGMLIGYVRGKRQIGSHLAPVLASKARHAALGSPKPPAIVSPSIVGGESLQATIHQRMFKWPGGDGAACEIRIFHSWHQCS